jgi:hypothetical protein
MMQSHFSCSPILHSRQRRGIAEERVRGESPEDHGDGATGLGAQDHVEKLSPMGRTDAQRALAYVWLAIHTIRQILVKIVLYDTVRCRTTKNKIYPICENCVVWNNMCDCVNRPSMQIL